MIKKVKYLLIVIPIILSISLAINLYKFEKKQKTNQAILNNISTYQLKIDEFDSSQLTLTKDLKKLKEEKKDKLWEYDRWIKWKQEIEEKIN